MFRLAGEVLNILTSQLPKFPSIPQESQILPVALSLKDAGALIIIMGTLGHHKRYYLTTNNNMKIHCIERTIDFDD